MVLGAAITSTYALMADRGIIVRGDDRIGRGA